MSGESWKLELEQLAEEVGDVAHLAVLEHRGELRADLGLGGLGVHPFDDAEPGAQDRARRPRTPGPPRARRRGRRAGGASAPRESRDTDEEVADEARLADAGGADDRDGPRLLLVAGRGVGALELAHLGRAAGERRAALGRQRSGTTEKGCLGARSRRG